MSDVRQDRPTPLDTRRPTRADQVEEVILESLQRAVVRRGLIALTLGTVVTVGVFPAQAEAPSQVSETPSYRYWSFWEHEKDSWTYASEGPTTQHPDDGALLGFRFGVSEDNADRSAQPRGTASFDDICQDTPRKSGTHRVALVVDFGTVKDAPKGERPPSPHTACALLAGEDTTGDALARTMKPLRYNADGLLCSLNGYPGSGCGEEVGQQRAQAKNSGGGGSSLGLSMGVGAVLALSAAALWQVRRRRQ
ncbi:SCO2322 family protein [Streptomyces sp. NPDC005438]|uniref:SCO2322 family protein n=1 Tax=Streptomyces sp. NPDC005438 TaxID=3156880 RepID=UPI0033B31C2A